MPPSFKTKPTVRHKAPAETETTDSLRLAETLFPDPAGEPVEEQVKRGRGRPTEGVKGFATRLSPETIGDIKALADGLRLRSEGKAIERAISFYKQHLLREVRNSLGDLGDEAELLRNAHKID